MRALLRLLLCAVACADDATNTYHMADGERALIQAEVREMFYHGYNKYMQHGFPWDELKPLTCVGRRWDRRERGTLDDSLGGFLLTLVDSLDMLAILDDRAEFKRGVQLLIEHLKFDRNITVSMFETTIRVVGGLTSAHQIALRPAFSSFGVTQGKGSWYKGELLAMALDLGRRLLPAFETQLGIPGHLVNMQSGLPTVNAARDTCTAAAGTILMEFGLLSRLSGEPAFEQVRGLPHHAPHHALTSRPAVPAVCRRRRGGPCARCGSAARRRSASSAPTSTWPPARGRRRTPASVPAWTRSTSTWSR
jgi:hypothetical protein